MNNTTPQAVQACHELLHWLIPQVDKFPRVRRFTLGDRLESALQEVLEATRHLWRLCHEFQVIPTRSYEHGARLIDDLGRQLGGWLRSLPATVAP